MMCTSNSRVASMRKEIKLMSRFFRAWKKSIAFQGFLFKLFSHGNSAFCATHTKPQSIIFTHCQISSATVVVLLLSFIFILLFFQVSQSVSISFIRFIMQSAMKQLNYCVCLFRCTMAYKVSNLQVTQILPQFAECPIFSRFQKNDKSRNYYTRTPHDCPLCKAKYNIK